MRQDIKSLLSKMEDAARLCKNVLECGEKIRELSPLNTGMDAYAEELTAQTGKKGLATIAAVKELNAVNAVYKEIKADATVSAGDKALLSEKMGAVQDMSPLFIKQNAIIRKNIETHLNSLRQESVDFRHSVNVIKNYLKAPDNRSFYG